MTNVCPCCGVPKSERVLNKQIFIDGSPVFVCSGCFHKAFLRTNLSRMLRGRRKRLVDEEVV